MDKRMYVVVNDRLTKSQRIPQASHAVAEYVYAYRDELEDWIKNHRTMVVLHCREREMESLSKELKSKTFRDGDLDNMLTAVAFEPMGQDEGNYYFKNMRLA